MADHFLFIILERLDHIRNVMMPALLYSEEALQWKRSRQCKSFRHHHQGSELRIEDDGSLKNGVCLELSQGLPHGLHSIGGQT